MNKRNDTITSNARPTPSDPWATDTADPARIFREMFPLPVPRIDWRLFVVFDDLLARGLVEKKEARRVV